MEATPREPDAPRILIVEDEVTQSTVLSEVLQELDYRPDCASTCAEGRQMLVKGRYACALVDLGLPDGSGQELLAEFVREDPELVPVVLTGDVSAETVIDTMRAGAFDYLTKPVDVTTLNASMARALWHHTVLRERSNLLHLLMEEREQLRARVDAATADIRQYATACETTNTRLRALVQLTQLSRSYLSEDELLRQVFERLSEQIALRCLAVCDSLRQKLAMVSREGDEAPRFQASDVAFDGGSFDPLLAQVDPEQVLAGWLRRHLGDVDLDALAGYVSHQTLQGRPTCTVAFYVDAERGDDPELREFLDMCGWFLAFEWEQGKLLLHVAHHASLGSIAVELARNFVQPLTAIRTAVEIVGESVVSPEGAEGMRIVQDNVERLRRQVQDFHKLTLLREDSIETVRLDEYVEQALDVLAVAIQ
ncbi:MAG: response regulator, partial [Candidatus Hydrogenedentes bacterium]|nr:response regulator [Candidatus Hydrogenedentota bacterium]